jgi:hypothetical protein
MRKVTTRKMSTKELEMEAQNEMMKEKRTEMTMEMGMATATEMMKEKARKMLKEMMREERMAFSGTPRRCPYRQLDTETNISIMNTVFCRLIHNI